MNRENALKNGLLILLLAFLFLPLLQQRFELKKLVPLQGMLSEPVRPSLGVETWFNGEFQHQAETYCKEKFGFRSTFIRLNNQIEFSLFRKAKANSVVIGKENYLFEENYIKAYYGQDFLGQDSIRSLMNSLRDLQESLAAQNKTLLVVYAAGKGSFFPEYFPEDLLDSNLVGTTNHKTMVKIGQELGLNQIDFNTFFVEQKGKTPYPLYPQYGIHWSHYGVCLVMDSMIKRLEHLRNIDMPQFSWTEIRLEQPHDYDYDIGDGLNLLFRLPSYSMAYPKLKLEEKPGQTKPSLLMIADSYYWDMYESGFREVLGNNHFWFYNRDIHPALPGSPTPTDLDLGKVIAQHDVIVLMATEATLNKLGWGWVERWKQEIEGNYQHSTQIPH
jgi:hypothetical protein